MRSLRLRVTYVGNEDMCLSELVAQWFNLQRLRSKASPIHPSFRLGPCIQFFHTFSVMCLSNTNELLYPSLVILFLSLDRQRGERGDFTNIILKSPYIPLCQRGIKVQVTEGLPLLHFYLDKKAI